VKRPEYTKDELHVMERMAHGDTRDTIAESMDSTGRGRPSAHGHASPSYVARLARSAADKTGCQSIVHAIAVMVANAWVSVDHTAQKGTANDTALHWLDTQIHSCTSWREFVELRTAYIRMTPGEQTNEDR
jgi:hypothetical protein